MGDIESDGGIVASQTGAPIAVRRAAMTDDIGRAGGGDVTCGVFGFIERAGCLGLPKPFARADLLAGVQALLERSAA